MKTNQATGKQYYPVSLQQEGVWLQAVLDTDRSIWNTSHSWRFTGPLDINALKRAVQRLIDRHDVLRTNFCLIDEKIYQFIHPEITLTDFFGYYDLSAYPDNIKERTAAVLENEIAQKVYDLEKDPLIRFTLIRLAQDDHVFAVAKHHIISDVSSRQIMWKEISSLYKTYITGGKEELEPIEFQYHDYSVWQHEFIKSNVYRDQKKYWLNQLPENNSLPRLNLPTDYPRPEIPGKVSHYKVIIEPGLVERLRSFSLRKRVSFSSVFLSAYYILLNRYSGQDDIIIGTLYRGRNRDKKNLGKLIGLFVNHVALRLDLSDRLTFSELLENLHRKTTEAYANQDFLFEDLLRTLHPERTAQYAPIFQVVFNMIKVSLTGMTLAGLEPKEWQGLELDTNITSHYDLSLFIRDDFKEMSANILYSQAIFNSQTIERMMAQYINVLINIINHPGKRLSDIEIITEAEKAQIINEFNNTGADYPCEKTIHGLFAEQVEKTPDRIALVFSHGRRGRTRTNTDNLCITYHELHERSGHLAGLLIEKGVESESIVAIKIERSIEMMIGIYGILKAGAAYLPIDPDYPKERIDYMLKDSNAKILINKFEARISKFETNPNVQKINDQNKNLEDLTILNLDHFDFEFVSDFGFRISDLNSSNLAYLIYTSGSTGKPKGVLIEHRSLVNRLNWMQKKYPIGHRDTILHKTPFTFDVSVWEIFWWSLVGTRVCLLAPGGEKDPKQIAAAIYNEHVTVMHFVPSMLRAFLEYIEKTVPAKQLYSLTQVIASGEALDVSLVSYFNEVLNKQSNTGLANLYGPTEATIDVSYFDCPREEKIARIPIGKPIDNTALIILNKSGRIQPIGIPGELAIGGVGLARGYLNRPELTHKKFDQDLWDEKDDQDESGALRALNGCPRRGLQHSAFSIPHSNLYRTGDLARWLPDGNIEFLGRMDHQVKIRGFRIELGEIEAALNEYSTINESIVVVIKQGETQNLCAYITMVDRAELDAAALKEYLSKKLPAYMVPAYFIKLEKLPLTGSGKIDRKALPDHLAQLNSGQIHNNYLAPQNDIQGALASVWQEVLGLQKIGITDNFFTLGGESIKAIQVASRLAARGYRLEIALLFKYPTIGQLWEYVKKKEIALMIDQKSISGEIKPIPIQKWFLGQNFSCCHHWNLAMMLYRVQGFNEEILKKVFVCIAAHHDALRIVLDPAGQTLLNKKAGDIVPTVEIHDLTAILPSLLAERIEREAGQVQASIDLFNGPLIKTALFKTISGDHLLIVIHHLAIDGISWRILLEDISTAYTAYEQAENGREIILPPKTHSFQQWSEALATYSRSLKLRQEYDYWLDICNAAVKIKEGETEKEKGKLKDYYRCKIELPEEESRLFLNEAHKAYNTEINDLLLTALVSALQECFGWRQIIIHLEGHGREPVVGTVNIDRTVGWFTSLFPVFLEIREQDDLSMHIRRVKENLRKIPHHGIGYGILRYLADLTEAERRDIEIQSVVGFNYLGRFDMDFQRTGFQRSPFGTGHSKSPMAEQVYDININGLTEKARLTFMINGNTGIFPGEQIEQFAQYFKNALQKIAHHCSAINETILTPADFDMNDLELDELEIINESIPPHNIHKIYNLSPMQEGMLFHYLYDPQSRAYTMQLVYSLEGNVDVELLKKSYEQLVENREIFRTAFIYKGIKKTRQIVLKTRAGEFTYHDLSHVETGEKDERFQEIIALDRERGFDLLNDILFRFTLIKRTVNHYLLLVSNHHIILDGWSTNLWLKDLLIIYAGLKTGNVLTLENVPPYNNYIKWLAEQDKNAAREYWRNYLAGCERITQLQPLGNVSIHSNHNTNNTHRRVQYVREIDKETAQQLTGLANRLGITLNAVLQVIWAVVLSRCTSGEDIIFGNVISGRSIPLERVEHIPGLFINTIPLRIMINEGQTFTDLVRETGENFVEAQSYGYLSLAEVQAQAPQTVKNGRLFAHLFIFENYPVNKELTGIDFSIKRQCSIEYTEYDLNIMIIPRENLIFHLLYNEHTYDESYILRLAGYIEQVIRQVVFEPDQLISNIEILSQEEKQIILYKFNNTSCPYPREKTIHGLFAEQVEKTPDSIAIVFSHGRQGRTRTNTDNLCITYRELHERSDRLAGLLIEKGVLPDNIVGIKIERSIEMIIGIFGILKAGAAYLPIDPDYPQERIDYMLKDSNAKILINKFEARISKSETNPNVQKINDQNKNEYYDAALVLNLNHLDFEFVSNFGFRISDLNSSNLAYLIYTSGSTGKPKGVLIEHRSLVNRLNWMQKKYPIGHRDTILHKTPFTFDVSVWEIFWWSLVGARVCLLVPGGEKDPKQIAAAIYREHITVMHFVPSMLRAFLEYIEKTGPAKQLYSLKQVIASGEALDASLVSYFNKVLNKQNNIRLANLYGPTEATIDVSYFDCPQEEEIARIPIGKPIDNTTLIILNKSGRIQPIGIPGELAIGGVGLARGYLNRPELTHKKFDQDLWDEKDDQDESGVLRTNFQHSAFRIQHSNLYRTGDLARWLPDCNIEFLGRIDHQVKIRGFRIELGEIENALHKHPAIAEAVVMAIIDPGGDNTLCAYIVSSTKNQEDLNSEDIRGYLGQTLPGYMIPSYFIPLEKIPLTASGKVDRKSLPPFEPGKTLRSGTNYEKPMNDIEEKLAALWQELLKVEKIGVHDNFFNLGGHSLKAMNFINQIYNIYNLEIPLRVIFDNPTISGIAQWLHPIIEKRQKVIQILMEIEALSDEQVNLLVFYEKI